MANLPENPNIGDTVLEDFEMIDNDNDAYFAARNSWIEGGKQGTEPKPDDFPLSMGTKIMVYFWNGLCWLQWVYNENSNPMNIYIPEQGE